MATCLIWARMELIGLIIPNAVAVGLALRENRARGSLLCGSGVAAAMAANRLPGIRSVTSNGSRLVSSSGRASCVPLDKHRSAARTQGVPADHTRWRGRFWRCRDGSTHLVWSRRPRPRGDLQVLAERNRRCLERTSVPMSVGALPEALAAQDIQSRPRHRCNRRQASSLPPPFVRESAPVRKRP